MEKKKSSRAELQNKKVIFFEIGLALALFLTLVAFNWSSRESTMASLVDPRASSIDETQELIPITEQALPPPPPPPVTVSDVIDIIDDNKVDFGNINFGIEDPSPLPPPVYISQITPEKKEETTIDESIPYGAVEEPPLFNNGDANSFPNWVMSRVQYPATAADNGIQGTVQLSFDVGTDGLLSNIKVLRDIDPLLAQEALRVVKMSPPWTPGRQNGQKVKVSYVFPVKFRLN